jgi:predicted Zn finger-like uncharacterized protein
MLLATRCPFCETVFRLLPAHLTLRRGLVRCGHCHEVFDASSSLYDISDGVSFENAKPVTADEVAALVTEPDTGHAVESQREAGGQRAGKRFGRPAAEHLVEPAAEHAAEPAIEIAARREDEHSAQSPVEHVVEPAVEAPAQRAVDHPVQSAAEYAEPDLESPAQRATESSAAEPTIDAPVDSAAERVTETVGSHAEPVIESPAEPFGTPVPPVIPEPAVEPAATPAAHPQAPASEALDSHSTAPDFRAEAWDPWAPAPDAAIDRRIRHNASTIPYKPVTIPSSAQPPLTLELTDAQPLHLEKATAAPVQVEPIAEPQLAGQPVAREVETTPERVLEQEVAEPPPHAWSAVEPVLEPAHETAVESAAEREHERVSATVHEPVHEESAHESARETVHAATQEAPVADHEPTMTSPSEPAIAPDDRTVMPSAEPDREPSFRAPSAAADLEPRFGAAPVEPFAAAPLHDDDAFAVTREPREDEPHRVGWRIAGAFVSGLLLALLIAQLAWWQRETVMVTWPDSQPLFEHACARLGCTVGPPRDIDGLLVEPSDLRQVDGPHKLELKMPLRNRFNLALAYPAVELTLLDEHNNIAVRRVLWPQDYVRPGTPIAAGLPARSTQTMIVRLDTGDAVATNFRVQIFYP